MGGIGFWARPAGEIRKVSTKNPRMREHFKSLQK